MGYDETFIQCVEQGGTRIEMTKKSGFWSPSLGSTTTYFIRVYRNGKLEREYKSQRWQRASVRFNRLVDQLEETL